MKNNQFDSIYFFKFHPNNCKFAEIKKKCYDKDIRRFLIFLYKRSQILLKTSRLNYRLN